MPKKKDQQKTKVEVATDPRIKKILDEVRVEYSIDADGDFNLIMKIDDEGRTQVGCIYSNTFELFGNEMRTLTSVGLVTEKGPFSERVANLLLQANGAINLGAWQAAQLPDGTSIASYAAYVPADAESNVLMNAFIAVLRMADAVESDVSGNDNF